MRLSARCPAQRPATDWGQHTAAPDALKTRHFKQTFAKSNILPTRNDSQKNAVAPLPRPGDAPFGASSRLAHNHSLGAGHFRPQCIENRAFQKTLTDFNILPTRYGTKILHWRLHRGQSTCYSTRRPAQRPASDWGRRTAAPNALKTGHSKQTFTNFNILLTEYGTERRIGASTKARRRAFQRSARQFGGGETLPSPMQ